MQKSKVTLHRWFLKCGLDYWQHETMQTTVSYWSKTPKFNNQVMGVFWQEVRWARSFHAVWGGARTPRLCKSLLYSHKIVKKVLCSLWLLNCFQSKHQLRTSATKCTSGPGAGVSPSSPSSPPWPVLNHFPFTGTSSIFNPVKHLEVIYYGWSFLPPMLWQKRKCITFTGHKRERGR